MTKYILSAAILMAAITSPTLSFAQDTDAAISSITYQSSRALGSETVFENALNLAGDATLAADKDWFRITYREIDRKTVKRNANSDAESRYMVIPAAEGDSDEKIELIAPPVEQTDTTIRLEFQMGTGPLPDTRHTYSVGKPSA